MESIAVDFGNDGIGTHIQAYLLKERCLILRLENYDHTSAADEQRQKECIILFDRKNMRPFAYYSISGDPLPRFPRFHYLAERSR